MSNALECAVSKAFDHYEAIGRASAKKQHNTAMRTRAPIDFRGTVAAVLVNNQPARSIVIECKEVAGTAFPLNDDHISERQRTALDSELRLGATALLVVDFTEQRECYAVLWKSVQHFLKAPWRASLSIDWFRDVGELVPNSDRDNPKRRAAWVLDSSPSEWRVAAGLKVAQEKAEANGKTVALFPVEQKPSINRAKRFAERPRPGTPEHKEYLIECANAGMKRQMGTRKPMFGKPRAKQGWNPR